MGLSQQALLHRFFGGCVILGDGIFVDSHGVKKGAVAPCNLFVLPLVFKVINKL